MKALIQRVHHATVTVDDAVVGEIGFGVLAYIGLGHDDDLTKGKKLIDKILTYRIFENDTDPDKLGKLDKSVLDLGGGLLLVSQFTLMANTDKGRRPDFAPAMHPSHAKALFAQMTAYAHSLHNPVATGEFGANMQVGSVNDGPINFLLEA